MVIFKLYRKKNKIKNMTISGKLRLISTVTLVVPLLLATMCVMVIYLTFISGDYGEILGVLKEVNNTPYALQACEFIDTEFRNQLAKTGDEQLTDIFPEMQEEQGIAYVQATKNGEIIYETQQYQKPDNFDYLYNAVNNGLNKTFSIINDEIVFRTTISQNDNIYEIVALGHVRMIHLYEKTSILYRDTLLTNLLFLVIVIICSYLLSKFLTRVVFKRVEYSLTILSNGVEKISSGNLEYRIKYDRKDEFTQICNSFNEMADRLEESIKMSQRQEQSRKELIMSVTHDIFSPLTSIKAYIEGIENGIASTPESQKKYFAIIKSKTEQIEKMISELLFFSKLEYGEDSNSVKEKVNLDEFLNEYVRSSDSEYALKNVQINIAQNEKAVVIADKLLLSRMITNIIDNSQKYSNKSICHVEISLKKSGDKCILKINDDGPGVAAASIEHIFEVLYRSDTARQQTDKGNGIGLSIVNNIATKSLGGSVRAENIPSGGLSIIIEIPTVKE